MATPTDGSGGVGALIRTLCGGGRDCDKAVGVVAKVARGVFQGVVVAAVVGALWVRWVDRSPRGARLAYEAQGRLAVAVKAVARPLRGRASPPWPGDTTVSASWLTGVLRAAGVLPHGEVASVDVMDLAGNRGLASTMLRLAVTYTDGVGGSAPPTFILKSCNTGDAATHALNIALRKDREAAFYNTYGKRLPGLSRVYWAAGSRFTGDFVLLMEDLAAAGAVGVNMQLGNQVWGVTADAVVKTAPAMLSDMFTAAARLHALRWRDATLLDEGAVLKGADWYRGRGRGAWELGVECAARAWANAKLRMAVAPAAGSEVAWSPKLVAILDAAYASASWEALQARLADPRLPFCLTHGDFHASNMLWKPAPGTTGAARGATGELILLDWSEVGVWEPLAELGQTMISDVRPEVWRAHDADLVRAYWRTLTTSGGVSPVDFPFEDAWAQYCRAGVEKWLWMLPILTLFQLPARAMQYFHDQTLAFIEDHGDAPAYHIGPIACLLV